MIKSFADKQTEALFEDRFVAEFQAFARPAKRKLTMIDAAKCLDDLKIPPGNRLEKLQGGLRSSHSIRINDQWRIVFQWIDDGAYNVSIVDYH